MESQSKSRSMFGFNNNSDPDLNIPGGMIGGASGLYSCKTATQGLSGKLMRTQILNVVGKQGASSGQAFGVIALMYSVSCAALEYAGIENEVNTLTSGTLTGLLFKSSAGRHGLLKGGGVGFGLSALYCLFYRSDVFTKSFLSRWTPFV